MSEREMIAPEDEEGQSTVLFLGMMLLVLSVVAVVVGATSVNLESRRLLAAADGAASAASLSATASGDARPTVSEGQALAAAEEYLYTSGADDRFDGVEITGVRVTDGGRTAHIELATSAELPMVSAVLPAEVTVTAESHARVTLRR
ncbi:MAG: hypothetical protein Q4F53_01675 [Nesterenkonia sp.]|uniref:pilus assembly protein TadG-related protein n=1 Tax=Nesterenkonia marinintestina TaxID=2979865 RepID=UPI0021C1BAD1|nr:pilus assembly protein TadG-related protein [Nesterenkonia sp. GX14115]MDO5492305.1 hypothetical protein [Nesterenkonia sp.]